MADIKISELAGKYRFTVDKLLSQIKQAGLPYATADELISDHDQETLRETLLGSLRSSHGGRKAGAPSKITLKRKTLGTLKSAATSGSGRSKTVNVEVRRKRTYVKRSAIEPPPAETSESEVVPAQPALAEQTAPAATVADAAVETGKQQAPADAESTPAPAEPATPQVTVPPAEPGRGKAVPRRRKSAATESDDPAGKKKTHLRNKAKAQQTPKRQTRNIHVNDDFVLEGDDYDGMGPRGRRSVARRSKTRLSARTHAFEKPTEFIARQITIREANSVTELAQKMSVKSAEIIKVLFNMGVMADISQVLDRDTATLLIEEIGHKPRFVSDHAIEEQLAESLAAAAGQQQITRAPVVTVMGHVDHGKTSLLDYIRKASVASREAGGITQHIGAYHVNTGHGMVSFLDTPGHAAFTAMRSRGASATDVIVLVVAADDGVKPQTEEAVQHARAAKVPLVVAINKIDKLDTNGKQATKATSKQSTNAGTRANAKQGTAASATDNTATDRVKNELAALEVIPEDWGGETPFIAVSAVTGQGIDDLLEAVLLQAELLELKAYTDVPGQGVVVESRLEKGRGSVASVLVQNGTLRSGDMVLAGVEYGRVRALVDQHGKQVGEAGPAIPVEILGLSGAPEAGDEFVVVADEKQAREVARFRQQRHRNNLQSTPQSNQLEAMFASLGKAEKQLLHVIVKADVRGSVEAIIGTLQTLGNEEVEVDVVATGVGGISAADAHLAATCQAMIIGFNVRADRVARDIVEHEGLQLRYYNVIYDVIDDARALLSGMLAPEIREEIVGIAEVRNVFNSPRFGQIAGSMVIEGTVYRSKPIRVLRDNVVIYEGELESLRRFKEDTTEVRNGMECGIGVRNYNDVRIGDKIEVYQTTEVARTL